MIYPGIRIVQKTSKTVLFWKNTSVPDVNNDGSAGWVCLMKEQ